MREGDGHLYFLSCQLLCILLCQPAEWLQRYAILTSLHLSTINGLYSRSKGDGSLCRNVAPAVF
jgi:hypothetical protein